MKDVKGKTHKKRTRKGEGDKEEKEEERGRKRKVDERGRKRRKEDVPYLNTAYAAYYVYLFKIVEKNSHHRHYYSIL